MGVDLKINSRWMSSTPSPRIFLIASCRSFTAKRCAGRYAFIDFMRRHTAVRDTSSPFLSKWMTSGECKMNEVTIDCIQLLHPIGRCLATPLASQMRLKSIMLSISLMYSKCCWLHTRWVEQGHVSLQWTNSCTSVELNVEAPSTAATSAVSNTAWYHVVAVCS